MATMFREFSFDAASRLSLSMLEAERAAMNVSPTSMPFAPPRQPARLPTPPPCSVGELAHRLDQQNLCVEADPLYRSETTIPPSHNASSPTQIPELSPQSSYSSRLSSAILRMQRQANMRMQCSQSHIDDLTALVERMIENDDQCNVCDPKSRASSTSSMSDEDEGVDLEYTPSDLPDSFLYGLKFRRSTDRLEGCTLVSKSIRMRKKMRITKRSK